MRKTTHMFFQWLEQTLQTWQARCALIVGAAGGLIAFFVALKRCVVLLNRAYESGVFLINVQEEVKSSEGRLMERLDQIDAKQTQKLRKIEEGLSNQIQSRRILMEVDSKGWVELDPKGRATWSNSLWREATGLDSNQLLGKGWLNGIATNEREEFFERLMSAITDAILFDGNVTLTNRKGKTTQVRLIASPLRSIEDESQIISFLGYFTPVNHERR